MFTGIVEEIGIVKETSSNRLAFEAHKVLEGTKVGDSIAVNGVCLTVVSLGNRGFSVDVMPETRRCTNLSRLQYGDQVNLERALMLGGRCGGHLVLGHIDDTGEVMDVTGEETTRIMRISAAAQLMPYIVSKGFIAVDGVSLTIVNSAELFLIVSSVAYTSKQTTLGSRMRGDIVNLETDIIAKYVERFTKGQAHSLDFELLKEYGFVGQRDGS